MFLKDALWCRPDFVPIPMPLFSIFRSFSIQTPLLVRLYDISYFFPRIVPTFRLCAVRVGLASLYVVFAVAGAFFSRADSLLQDRSPGIQLPLFPSVCPDVRPLQIWHIKMTCYLLFCVALFVPPRVPLLVICRPTC